MRSKRSIKYAPRPQKVAWRIAVATSRERIRTLMQARNQLQRALVWMRDDNRTHLSRDMAHMALNMRAQARARTTDELTRASITFLELAMAVVCVAMLH